MFLFATLSELCDIITGTLTLFIAKMSTVRVFLYFWPRNAFYIICPNTVFKDSSMTCFVFYVNTITHKSAFTVSQCVCVCSRCVMRLCCVQVCKERQLVKQQCNSTHDQLCECAPGFHLVVEFCITHSTCPPGYGVTALGKTDI